MSETVDQVLSLEDFDAAFNEAEIQERDNSKSKNPPDGKYTTKIERAEFKTSKSGNPQFSIGLKIASGKHKGRFLFKNWMLSKDKDKLKYLKTDLAVLGVKLDKISSLQNKLEDLLNLHVNVTKKDQTGTDFYNVYINELVDAPTEDDEPASGDLPF